MFVAACGLSLVAASGGVTPFCGSWASHCGGLPCYGVQAPGSRASVAVGSLVVSQGLNCSATCGIFPDQGLNPCPLHWQEDFCSLHHRKVPEPNSGITRWSICSRRWRSSIQSAKTRLGTDSDSDHELLIAKFRLKLKKVGKTTHATPVLLPGKSMDGGVW